MEIREIGPGGVLKIIPDLHCDNRGRFCESYSKALWQDAGFRFDFVQDNFFFSPRKGVLRGLHYQMPPATQDKLVRVCRGSILNVAVDIRRASPTFGDRVCVEIPAGAWNQVFVPKGFAHGFLTLEDDTEVICKVTDYNSPKLERAIRFDDPDIGVEWPMDPAHIIVSDKDRTAPFLATAETL